MSAFGIRRVVPSDLTSVDRILTTTSGYARLAGSSPVTIPDVRLSLLEHSIAENPEGNLVLTQGEVAVGVGFSWNCGSVGWIGALAVLPDFQNLGGGRRLLAALGQNLEQSGAITIGMDLPQNAHRLGGVLIRSSFEPSPPTFCLDRNVPSSADWRAGTITTEVWRRGSASWNGTQLRELAGSFQRGFDPTPFVRATDFLGLGHTVVFRRNDRMVGLAVCHPNHDHGRTLSATGIGTLQVPMLLIDTRQGPDILESVIASLESQAAQWRADRIRLFVPGRYVTALSQFLSAGYEVRETLLRATLMGHPDACPADLVNATYWG